MPISQNISLESYIAELSTSYSPTSVSKKVFKHSPNAYVKARKNHTLLRLRTPQSGISSKHPLIADFVHTARLMPLNEDNQNLEGEFYFYANVFTSMTSQKSDASKWLKENIEMVDAQYKVSGKDNKGFPRKYRIKDAHLLQAIKKCPIPSSEDFLSSIEPVDINEFKSLYKDDCIALDAKLFNKDNLKEYFKPCVQNVIAKTFRHGSLFYLIKDWTFSKSSNREFTLFQLIPKAIRNKIFFSEVDIVGSQVSLTANWIVKNNLQHMFPEIISLSGFKDFGYFRPHYSGFSTAFGLSTKETKKMIITTFNYGNPIKKFNLMKFKNTKEFTRLVKIMKEVKKYIKLMEQLEPELAEKFKAKTKAKKKWQGSFSFYIYSRFEKQVRDILIEAVKEISKMVELPSILQVHDAVRFNFTLTDEDKEYIYSKIANSLYRGISLHF
jgi:hypothetical protein